MCGIVGIMNFNKDEVLQEQLNIMLNKISHRGPDFSNLYIKDNFGIGHCLLKIQDSSNLSCQPYSFNKYTLSYNGEVYNFNELREELILNGYEFVTPGDTEVVIKAFDLWGLKAVEKFNGSFAIALYDNEENKIHLVRDRMGIKPLYYYIDNGMLIFSSEVKSMLECKNIDTQIDIETILLSFACKLWMPYSKTFFKNINIINPGTIMSIDSNGIITKQKYYKPEIKPLYNNERDAILKFRNCFEKSIKYKSLSTVPVATFLSGGIDSSIVTKQYSDITEEPVSAFTICYNGKENKDLKYALDLVNENNIKHYKVLVKPEDLSIKMIDNVIYHMEEILLDKVYISDFINFKYAKDKGFTVILNGQGSDEFWLGYIFTWEIFNFIGNKFNKKDLIDNYYLKNMIFKNKINNNLEDRLKKLLEEHVLNSIFINEFEDKFENYTIHAIQTILHNLLLQEDKLSMAHSIECRVPFVDDTDLVELALSIPANIKTFDKREKYILRSAYKNILPDSIVKRKKYPFPEPPDDYNTRIMDLCKEHWDKIITNDIIINLININDYNTISDFSDRELWWLLVIYRFTEVFNLDGVI